MTHELNILSTEEEYAHVREAIHTFLETYGDCEVRLYRPNTVIEEDGLKISGEYGTLDALFSPVSDPRLKRAADFEDGRMWLKWNAVIFAAEEEL
jgi:hypothetical protein